jgi:hypothetical protein
MKVFKNAIDKDFAEYCLNAIKKLSSSSVWSSSTLFWPEGIKKAITGSCVTSIVEDDIKEQILSRVREYLPENIKDISVMFYVWQQNSGISTHTDSGYNFAATIYLNPFWDIDWGGTFLFYDEDIDWGDDEDDAYKKILKDSDNWKVLIPECGTMVLNTSEKVHMVTPISPLSPELRYTIQIWGHR